MRVAARVREPIVERTRLGEERLEGVVLDGGALRLLPIGLDALLEAEELPARVTDLHARLAEVNNNNLSEEKEREEKKKGR